MSGHFCYKNRTFRAFILNQFPTLINRQKFDFSGFCTRNNRREYQQNFLKKGKPQNKKILTNICKKFFIRRRWDLNPRWNFSHNDFRDRHLKPLGHFSNIFIFCLILSQPLLIVNKTICKLINYIYIF